MDEKKKNKQQVCIRVCENLRQSAKETLAEIQHMFVRNLLAVHRYLYGTCYARSVEHQLMTMTTQGPAQLLKMLLRSSIYED